MVHLHVTTFEMFSVLDTDAILRFLSYCVLYQFKSTCWQVVVINRLLYDVRPQQCLSPSAFQYVKKRIWTCWCKLHLKLRMSHALSFSKGFKLRALLAFWFFFIVITLSFELHTKWLLLQYTPVSAFAGHGWNSPYSLNTGLKKKASTPVYLPVPNK